MDRDVVTDIMYPDLLMTLDIRAKVVNWKLKQTESKQRDKDQGDVLTTVPST